MAMPKTRKGATAGTAAPKGEEATMLSEGSTVQTSGQGWLPLRWAGLEGYELARVGDRVRSWRKPGGLGGGKCGVSLNDHPTEIKVRSGVVQLGVVCGCEAGGRQNRRNMAVQVELLRTAVLGDELAGRELERRLGRLQALESLRGTERMQARQVLRGPECPDAHEAAALPEATRDEPDAAPTALRPLPPRAGVDLEVETHIEMLDSSVRLLVERVEKLTARVVDLADRTVLARPDDGAGVAVVLEKLAALEGALASTPLQQDKASMRTMGRAGGTAGEAAPPAGRYGKNSPWEHQRVQLAAVVAELGYEIVADCLGVDRRSVGRVLSGQQRSFESPEVLDYLYVAVRSSQLDGADDKYDAMVSRLSRLRSRRRRGELEAGAWSMRGEF